MNLNKKGFAISSVMYLILVMALLIVAILLSLLNNRRSILEKQKREVLNSFESDLVLSKITYVDVPFNNWTLVENSSVSNGVLTVGSQGGKGEARSDYLYVNGNFFYFTFDLYGTNAATYFSNNSSGLYWMMNYYDAQKALTPALNGATSNGFARGGVLGVWSTNITWTGWNTANRYGPNVIYTNIDIKSGYNYYSAAPIKVRNIKLYVENLQNSFYLINLKLKSGNTIKLIKYELGLKPVSYFRSNGTVSSGTPIRVTENGTYTVYVKDNNGIESIATIEINEIQ